MRAALISCEMKYLLYCTVSTKVFLAGFFVTDQLTDVLLCGRVLSAHVRPSLLTWKENRRLETSLHRTGCTSLLSNKQRQPGVSDLQVVKDDAGAEEVVVDADEVRQLGVQHHADPLLPQSQSLLLQTHLNNLSDHLTIEIKLVHKEKYIKGSF